MLYDILPPLVFFLALGGIIFLMARVSLRVRRADLESSISAVATAPAPTPVLTAPRRWGSAGDTEMADLLRPSQKGVKVITSRMGLLFASMQTAGQALKAKTKQLPTTWRNRRNEIVDEITETDTETIETVVEVPTVAKTETPAGGLVLPLESPKRQKAKQLMGQLKSVTSKVQERSQQQLEALKRVAKNRRRAETAGPSLSETTVTPAAVTPTIPRLKRSVAPAKIVSAPITSSFRATGLIGRRAPGASTPALEQVKNLMAEENYELAEELLLPHIVNHPKDTVAYLMLGEIALAREAWDEAQEIYEQVLRINNQTRGAYAGLGLAAYRSGNFTKALQMLQRALNEDSTNREVLEAVLSLAQKLDNKALQHSIEEQLQELDHTASEPVRA